MTHICVSKLTIIGSYNGLSPRRRQAIIWTNAGILLIRPLGTKFSEILITIRTFSFMKMHLKMSSAKWPPFCLVLNVLMASRAAERHSCSGSRFDLTLSFITYYKSCWCLHEHIILVAIPRCSITSLANKTPVWVPPNLVIKFPADVLTANFAWTVRVNCHLNVPPSL